MDVVWSPEAIADLDGILTYIEQENPVAAKMVFDVIEQGCNSLDHFPNRGRPSRMPGKRDLVFTDLPYIAVYHVRHTYVEILRIYHSAQHWP